MDSTTTPVITLTLYRVWIVAVVRLVILRARDGRLDRSVLRASAPARVLLCADMVCYFEALRT